MSKKDSHGIKDISAQLSQLADWDETEEGSGFGEIPNDKYQCKIDKAYLNNAKSSGRLQITWELEIVSGEHKGRKLWVRHGLDDVDQRSFARTALARLGVEWPKPKKLPGILEELEGTYCQVTTRNREDSDMPNVYFDKALDSDDLADADDDDDEKPKKKSTKKAKADEDDDDEDEPPKKKGKKSDDDDDDDDDEDDSSDDDDEDDDEDEDEDKPKKKGKDDDDEDEDDEDEDEPKKKKKSKDEPTVECTFTDDDLKKSEKKEVKSLAKEHDFDLDDYDQLTTALGDIAEHVGVSGTFKSAKKLLAAIAEESGDSDSDDDD